jgi:hypothetical protein
LSAVDYDFYEEEVSKSINTIMAILNCTESIDYKIIYLDTTVYIELL